METVTIEITPICGVDYMALRDDEIRENHQVAVQIALADIEELQHCEIAISETLCGPGRDPRLRTRIQITGCSIPADQLQRDVITVYQETLYLILRHDGYLVNKAA